MLFSRNFVYDTIGQLDVKFLIVNVFLFEVSFSIYSLQNIFFYFKVDSVPFSRFFWFLILLLARSFSALQLVYLCHSFSFNCSACTFKSKVFWEFIDYQMVGYVLSLPNVILSICHLTIESGLLSSSAFQSTD